MARILRGDDVVVGDLEIARTSLARMKGLGLRSRFEPGQGLLITPCNSVHTFWPRLAIDVVFLSADFRVLRICASLPYRRLSPIVFKAHQVLELPAGTAGRLGLEEGQILTFEP